MVPVFAHLYDACMERGLPVGIAPNVKVSIVLLPEECRWLSEHPQAHRWQRVKLAALRGAFGVYFRARLWRRRSSDRLRLVFDLSKGGSLAR